MSTPLKVGDLLGSRRDALRLGGLGLLGASIDGVWPLRASATGEQVRPRGNARQVIFFEVSGAISHTESFDFKENAGMPKDLDVREVYPGLYLPHALFPRLAKHMQKLAILRSLRSHEEVHFRAQYYVQTGRQNNLAIAREIPSIGSVIASEMEPRRRTADTFPLYMSFNLEKGSAGALSTGFLPARFSVVDINTQAAIQEENLGDGAARLLKQRWSLLQRLRDAERTRLIGYGREMAAYENFYGAAYQLISDPRWPQAFRVTDEDRERYGDNPLGIACILARNVLAQDGGTRYIHICHPGWDHHTYIWDRSKPTNHYTQCAQYDQAFTALLEDLSLSPSKADRNKTMLDETLVVSMSEFGRTPGALNNMAGRDHYNQCFPALFAGAGVQGGRILGRSDADGAECLETGWDHKEQTRIENVVSTMYSALGIDWSKQVNNTPSGRPYVYVDPLGANGDIPTDEIATIYG
ncbi:MAG: hypothetical protein CMJ59_04630 [Planctomycetaceae bacterium]|nr:hypothetical protein [Planctomycetaceae bacterium]